MTSERDHMSMMSHLGEALWRDIILARKYFFFLLFSSTLIITISRCFILPKKCLICFNSLILPPYPEISNTLTREADKQHDSLYFNLLMQQHAFPHLLVTLCKRPWKHNKPIYLKKVQYIIDRDWHANKLKYWFESVWIINLYNKC